MKRRCLINLYQANWNLNPLHSIVSFKATDQNKKLSVVTVCFPCFRSSQNLSMQCYSEFSSDLDRGSRQENNDDNWCQTRIMQINLNGTWEQNKNPNSIQFRGQDTQTQKNALEIHTPTKWRKFLSTHFLAWMYFLKRAWILFTLILSYKLYIINSFLKTP